MLFLKYSVFFNWYSWRCYSIWYDPYFNVIEKHSAKRLAKRISILSNKITCRVSSELWNIKKSGLARKVEKYLIADKEYYKNPAGIYLLRVNYRNTEKSCEICSKLLIKPQQRQTPMGRSAVFLLTLNIFDTLF